MLHTFCYSDHQNNTTNTIETFNTDALFKQLTYSARFTSESLEIGEYYTVLYSIIQYDIERKGGY
jgi:hypothetical protein